LKYEQKPSKGYVEKLKRAGCVFTSNDLKTELEKQLHALGISQNTVNVIAEPVPENRPDTDPQTLHVSYPSLYDAHDYIADEVKIEVSVRSLQIPFSNVSIQSILSEINPSEEAYPEKPFTVDAVEARKTFLEKIFLLHEEFGKPDVKRIRSERMSRHLYDLSTMMGTDIEAQALADDELYFALIAHREAYQRISWVDYASLAPKTIAFIPPADVLDLYKKDYQTMQEQMIYGETIAFDKLIEKLSVLQEKFRDKK
jgi:hypothetical protein